MRRHRSGGIRQRGKNPAMNNSVQLFMTRTRLQANVARPSSIVSSENPSSRMARLARKPRRAADLNCFARFVDFRAIED